MRPAERHLCFSALTSMIPFQQCCWLDPVDQDWLASLPLTLSLTCPSHWLAHIYMPLAALTLGHAMSPQLSSPIYICACVAIHALTSTHQCHRPCASQRRTRKHQLTTEVSCLLVCIANAPSGLLQKHAIALDTSACLSFHKSQETNLITFFLSQDKLSCHHL
jgi:hypothetical protein